MSAERVICHQQLMGSGASATPATSRRDFLMSLELAVGLALTAVLVGLHVLVLVHGGGLWRDETSLFNVATAPSLTELCGLLPYTSHPVLLPLVIRGWAAAGFCPTDLGLRVLGMLFGLGLVAALWWNARTGGRQAPLIALALVGFCPVVLLYGDSLRGYGCGAMLMLLALGGLWRMVQAPRPGHILLAAAATILCVQCLYQNAILVLAMGVGAAAVAAARRQWRTVALVAAVGLVTAISLLPYIETMRIRDTYNDLIRISYTYRTLLKNIRQAIDGPALWAWAALGAVATAACVRALLRARRKGLTAQTDAALFLLVTGAAGLGGHILFLKVLSYPTTPWYYLTVLVLLGVCIDGGVNLLVAGSTAGRIARLVAVVAVVVVLGFGTGHRGGGGFWQAAHTRFTNVDLDAAAVSRLAAPEDLVIVNPCWPSITFERYYRGPAPWVAVPDIGHVGVHRYDRLAEQMASADPMRPVIDRMLATLRAGHRVWIVGEMTPLSPGQAPLVLPPAPGTENGWHERQYPEAWTSQLVFALQTHAPPAWPVEVPAGGPVNPYENLPLSVVEGWRD